MMVFLISIKIVRSPQMQAPGNTPVSWVSVNIRLSNIIIRGDGNTVQGRDILLESRLKVSAYIMYK